MHNLNDYPPKRTKQMNCILGKRFLESTVINTVAYRTFYSFKVSYPVLPKPEGVGNLYVEDWNGQEGRPDN